MGVGEGVGVGEGKTLETFSFSKGLVTNYGEGGGGLQNGKGGM